ncbi:MAG: GC-type dockerin domain-anchored protein, partial [Phycisphaerales bacterium]|nr:GC-type dockerin domain-anchored protein [Phycisphaerales bacterium]
GIYTSNKTSSSTLADTSVCGNTPEQIYGTFKDHGGSCVQDSCDDCEDCSGDFNSDGEVNGQDLGLFLVEWGECAGCAADFNGDGYVNGEDLGVFLVAWGPCP